MPSEVDDPFPAGVLHVGVADVPLLWHNPIKYLGPAGNFMHFQRDFFAYVGNRFPESCARNTAADRIKLADQRIEFLPEQRALEHRAKAGEIFSFRAHCYSLKSS